MPKGVYVRTPEMIENIRIANQKKAQDPAWIEKMQKLLQDPAYIEAQKLGAQKRSQNPTWIEANKLGAQKRSQNPTWIEANRLANQKKAQDPAWIEANRVRNQKLHQDPAYIEAHGVAMQKLHQDPAWIEKMQKLLQDPAWREANKLGAQKRSQNPTWIEANRVAMQKRSQDPAWIEANRVRNQKLHQDPAYIEKMQKQTGIPLSEETRINMSCAKQGIPREEYTGHATERKYCEAFTPEFKERVDAWWDYTCPISDIHESEFGERHHIHHVYWQKSSCCIIDDGDKPYFIIKGKKHYYEGDPNKFVPLFQCIHSTVAGNKEQTCLDWVEYFEEMINTRYNGRSYYTREEYWGNGWYYYEKGKVEKYCDAITGEIYGKHLTGWQGYGQPKKARVKKEQQVTGSAACSGEKVSA